MLNAKRLLKCKQDQAIIVCRLINEKSTGKFISKDEVGTEFAGVLREYHTVMSHYASHESEVNYE